MAQKKKDKRQQKINQRRAEKTRERKHKNSSRPNTAKSTVPLQPMAPLMEYVRKHSATPEETNSNMEFLIEDSGQLVQEPEFAELLIDPLAALRIVAEIEQSSVRDINEDDDVTLEDLSDFTQALSKLLTPEVQNAILRQLKLLAERQEMNRNLAKAAHVKLLHSLLETVRTREVWTLIEFIRTLIEKSISAGYDLMENIDKLQDITGGESEQQMTELITRYPGLETFLENQMDQVYIDGLQALYKGDLALDLFNDDELGYSVSAWSTTVGHSIDLEQLKDLSELGDGITGYVEKIEPHITGLATPNRLAEMQAYIEQVMAQPKALAQWQPFLAIIKEDLVEDGSYEHFLTHAMIGQTIRILIQARKILAKS